MPFLDMDLTVHQPVFAGDTIHVECEVIEARLSASRPGRGLVRTRNKIVKHDGWRPGLDGLGIPGMHLAPDPDDRLLVACLCAAWCNLCGDYRATFDALAGEFGDRAHFAWVDIEDDEAVLGAVDVADFPTLLLASGDDIRFFGPVTPHAHTVRQLVQRALQGQLGPVADARLTGLPARIEALR